MNLLALKLLVTPTLIGVASWAGRRWGPAVSGWLVGLPLTSGPILFFLALNQGPIFARDAALGILAGTLSQALVCLVYARLARRWRWPVALGAGVAAFAAATLALTRVGTWPLGEWYGVVLVFLGAALAVMPRERAGAAPSVPLPAWDIPARMVVVTAYVIALTAAADWLGPHLTGLLSPFPLYAIVMAVFGHHLQGPGAAIQVLRGLIIGLFSFATFVLIVGGLIVATPLWATFTAGMAVALLVQALALWVIRRGLI